MNERVGVTDGEWAIIRELLPPERGRWARPAQDNRRYFEGILWVARTGAQWRHLPDEYGKWNSVFRRFRRWVQTGVFDAMLETLAEMASQVERADMVDSTVIRAHHCAVGIKRGLKIKKRSVARAAASRPRSMPAVTKKGAPSASRSRPVKHMTPRGSRS